MQKVSKKESGKNQIKMRNPAKFNNCRYLYSELKFKHKTESNSLNLRLDSELSCELLTEDSVSVLSSENTQEKIALNL